MQTVIYHNPRCSKSRHALELLEAQQLSPRVIEYLKSPPQRDELEAILALLQLEPRDIMRKNEVEYTQLGLANTDLDREELITAMLAHPKLIERPIIIHQGKAIIGRPPERVLELVSHV